MAVPYTFGTATAAIPLSQLDSNFSTTITIGNTAVQLGNTITALANVSLVNATVTSLASPITAAQGGTGLATLTSNNVVLGNGTGNVLLVAPGTSGNALVSNGTTWSSSAVSANVSSVTGILSVSNGGTGASSLTANNVLLGNGTSAVQIVAPGTSGNVLTSNGTSWSSTAPSSAMTLISTLTASNSSQLEWTGLSGYNSYVLIFKNLVVTSGGVGAYLDLRLGTGAGPTYNTSQNWWDFNYSSTASASVSNARSTANSRIAVWGASGGAQNGFGGVSGVLNINGCISSYPIIVGTIGGANSTGPDYETSSASGGVNASSTTTAIKIFFNNAGNDYNIISGTASLYGISS